MYKTSMIFPSFTGISNRIFFSIYDSIIINDRKPVRCDGVGGGKAGGGDSTPHRGNDTVAKGP